MMRFFVNKKEGNFFILSDEVLQHIKVSRVDKKPFICVYEKKFYVCILDNKLAKIEKELSDDHEFKHEVVLAAALINIKRYEWLIQKSCELGATKLIPLITQNTDNRLIDKLEKKLERWQQISISAAEQSFRNKAMEISKPKNFIEILNTELPNKFIAHEKIDLSQKQNTFPTNSIFLIGPEGGFTEEEIEMSKAKGFKIISFGKRILRAETASLFALSRIDE